MYCKHAGGHLCCDKINKPISLQNKQGVKSRHQGNGGVVKTWHQGVKGVKVQGEKS